MAVDYQNIVDNLFSKRYCLKSKKRTTGWNANDSGNCAGDSVDDYPLPDPELLFLEYSQTRIDNSECRRADEVAINTDNDCNGNRLSTGQNASIWKDFDDLKGKLNETRNKLSDKDMDQWHDHTKSTNPAGSVIGEIRRIFNPELCTQAWCKFYEILAAFPNLVRCRGRFRSLHLCEAPGAFIAALKHYVYVKKLWIKEWDWRANSLNPYYEGNPYDKMIADDRFILYTAKRWIFGTDDSGDLTTPTMLETLIQSGSDFDLVTADGSIDCQEDPNEQERQVFSLHFCETVCAFHTLRKGGHFVLKRFTMFERSSVALLYLICCAFEEVNIFKPVTSKSGNSEIYVVCESYKGLSPAYLTKLRAFYGRNSSNMASQRTVVPLKEIPLCFIRKAYEAQKFFIDHQLAMVRFNLATFRSWTPALEDCCNASRLLVVQRYLIAVGLSSEATGDNRITVPLISNYGEIPSSWLKTMPWQKRYGTFNQRESEKTGRPRYVLKNLIDELAVYNERLSVGGGVEFRTFIINDYYCPLSSAEWYKDNDCQLEPVYGRRISSLKNSKLCHGGMLMLYRNLRDLYEMAGSDELDKNIYQVESYELCQFMETPPMSTMDLHAALARLSKDQDCVWIDLTSTTMSKVQWIAFLISLLSSDKPPQSLEFTRSRLMILTRFSANVLAVLCACYEQVTLIARNNPAGMCTIKAENYRRLPAAYAQNFVLYLHRIKYGLVKRERNGDGSVDLLQFLPMRYLSEPTFHRKVQRFNGTVLLKICQDLLSGVTKKND